ncbi:twin-arginine translocase TatA/TatE family subunit [Hyphomicrobium sulfonivorans]|uniref:twin-arginine translocase TatA/TatE family subunit n=1 Tax=Hyphomicrobium sulfonivorans TaxID=121290 RepID=UPI001570B7DF|nr:twin-arginine translocase TatA/TatE family subunit [Hyphomicrobium sulfonivorans]NSL71651.1 twin-arginine translocase TatA/TatE family subunit [Hyphomicrobium sulfonivorans]
MGLSMTHLVLLLAVAVLLFGRGRIAGLMGDFGKGWREFKRGMSQRPQPQPVLRPVAITQQRAPRAIADLRDERY